ncbi:MAG: hypothetical protein QOE70_1321 [Chthoniobacter sp.]|jgi:hypothetical protein|nr:hypothetical protein [Chthoniobacter sp.]
MIAFAVQLQPDAVAVLVVLVLGLIATRFAP